MCVKCTKQCEIEPEHPAAHRLEHVLFKQTSTMRHLKVLVPAQVAQESVLSDVEMLTKIYSLKSHRAKARLVVSVGDSYCGQHRSPW